MRSKLLILLISIGFLTFISCEEDEEENVLIDILIANGWEFYDLNAFAAGQNVSSTLKAEIEDQIGATFSFYEDGTYSIDQEGSQFATGKYTLNEQSKKLRIYETSLVTPSEEDLLSSNLEDITFDIEITSGEMELSGSINFPLGGIEVPVTLVLMFRN